MKPAGSAVVPAGGLPGAGAWAHLALSALSGAELPSGFPRLPSAPRGVGPDGPTRGTAGSGTVPAGPLVLVRGADEDLDELADALSALAPMFPGVAAGAPAAFGDDAQGRLASLERLRRGARVVLATPAGLAAAAPSPAQFESRRLRLTLGGRHPRVELLERLSVLGYHRVDFVEGPGEYAARGAVVDFFPFEPLTAVRALYAEDVVESLRAFDPETQGGGAFLEEAWVVPARDGETAGVVSDWVSGRGLWVVEEGLEVPPRGGPCLRVAAPAPEGAPDYGARPGTRFQGRLDLAAERIAAWRSEGLRVALVCINRGEDERVQELFEGNLPDDACQFLIGPLRAGFVLPRLKLAVLTSSELFDRSYRSSPRWGRYASGARRRLRWRELKAGDFVVHQEYGVARYLGIEPMQASADQGTMDCLSLEFRGKDRLYVPMTDFRLVQKYIGSEGRRPRLSSLDTRNWGAVKAQVREGVRELAEELLRLQAARAALPGHAFPPDSRMEEEFAKAFPYEETPDQRRAIEEVKADMMSPHPMDRVVVGDVGFGKTEVAMRAALKCVSGLKQAAVLVPTTILADQHLRTFSRRFAEYPVRLAMLSRFETPVRQKQTLDLLRSGAVDIVIGTHRLLSPDVKFRDLGLVIVDEEHRFGVKDKERLKAMRKSVDALSLSATPIPRTLHQSLSGLRAVSLIESAPAGRQAIVTRVGPWSEAKVAEAVGEELARGGQVYFVNNRVRALTARVEALRKLLPGTRIAVAHGRMRSDALETTMWDFFGRKYDVLAASSIIESGLDIPTVNTLIVEDAHEFGLAQLYQLRGRIGRESRKACCWLFYPDSIENETALTEEAKKRLDALREFSELGSGLQLAMRDLEIRGAGDLLGAKQHGFVDAVGVEFYCELLNEEVGKLQGKPRPAEAAAVELDLRVPAFLPDDYLPGELERLRFYKRLLAAPIEDLPALRRELEELSGPAPAPVENLLRVMRLRAAAARAGVREVAQVGSRVDVYFRPDAVIEPEAVARWTARYGGGMKFLRAGEGDGVRFELDDEEPLDWLEGFLGAP